MLALRRLLDKCDKLNAQRADLNHKFEEYQQAEQSAFAKAEAISTKPLAIVPFLVAMWATMSSQVSIVVGIAFFVIGRLLQEWRWKKRDAMPARIDDAGADLQVELAQLDRCTSIT